MDKNMEEKEESNDEAVEEPPKKKVRKDALIERRKRQWDVTVKRARTWMSLFSEEEQPSFVSMYLKGNQIRFEGPPHMEAFCRDKVVQEKFRQCCLTRSMVFRNNNELEANENESLRQPLQIQVPSLNHLDYEWNGLCLLLPRIVKHFFRTDDKRVWSKFKAPFWWPEDVAFKSPNHARDGSPRLTVQEMQRVLHNYIEKCQQFYTHDSKEQIQSKMEEVEEEHGTPEKKVEIVEETPEEKEEIEVTEHVEEDIVTQVTMELGEQTSPESQNLKTMDSIAKDILSKCILKKPGRHTSIDEDMVCDSWNHHSLSVPMPTTLPDNIGRVDRSYQNCSINGTVYRSSGYGDCFYCSISLLLYGTEEAKHLLRLASLKAGLKHLPHLKQQTTLSIHSMDQAVAFLLSYTNDRAVPFRPQNQPTVDQLVDWTYRQEILECGKINAYSGLLQVKFMSCALNQPIQQHCMEPMDIFDSCVGPCNCQQGNMQPLHIMWSRLRSKGSMSHIQPVVFKQDVEVRPTSTFLIDDTRRCIMTFTAMCNGGDSWVQCENCCMWAHTLCVGMPDDSSVIRFSCCGNVASDSVIMTWPEKMNKPQIHQIAEALKLTDIRSLYDGNGLSNTIINFYLRYTLSKLVTNELFLGSTELTQELFQSMKQKNYNHTVLKLRHFPQDNLADKKVLVFPMCITEMWHWVLVAVCIESSRIFLLDSGNGNPPKQAITVGVTTFLNDVFTLENKPAKIFKELQIAKVPKQEGVDCGVHVLENAKRLFEKYPVKVLTKIDDISLCYKVKGQKLRAAILCTISALSTAANQ